jgi:hypothetical protein
LLLLLLLLLLRILTAIALWFFSDRMRLEAFLVQVLRIGDLRRLLAGVQLGHAGPEGLDIIIIIMIIKIIKDGAFTSKSERKALKSLTAGSSGRNERRGRGEETKRRRGEK